MKLRTIRRFVAHGFTLIELMLVMVILATLAAIVVPRLAGHTKEAQKTRAITDISMLGTALGVFEVQNGRYPTTAEGLDALMNSPGGLTTWKGPYLERAVGKDPWGNPYVYTCPGTHNVNGYDLYSFGPSGEDGAEDNIDNWTAR